MHLRCNELLLAAHRCHVEDKLLSRHACDAESAQRLSVVVDGAKVEYGKGLDRPLFTVSLHDAFGHRLEAAQDSPPGHYHRPTRTISAGHELQFRTPMQQMPAGEQHHTSWYAVAVQHGATTFILE